MWAVLWMLWLTECNRTDIMRLPRPPGSLRMLSLHKSPHTVPLKHSHHDVRSISQWTSHMWALILSDSGTYPTAIIAVCEHTTDKDILETDPPVIWVFPIVVPFLNSWYTETVSLIKKKKCSALPINIRMLHYTVIVSREASVSNPQSVISS